MSALDLFLHAPKMMHSSDASGRLVAVNHRWLERLGYRADEVLGRPALDFLAEESRQRAERDILPRLRETGRIEDEPLRFITRSGKPLDALVSSQALRNHRGAIVRTSTVVMDVTRARREDARLRRHAKLEALGRMAGGIAHEFNNLATTLRSLVHHVRRHLEPDHPAVDRLDQMLAAGDRMTWLTRQLLALDRKLFLLPQALRANEVVKGLETLFQAVLGGSIALELDLDPDAGSVRADRDHLRKVLLAFAVLAREVMPAGGSLSVATGALQLEEEDLEHYPDASPGPHVLFAFRFSSQVLDPESRDRLLDPYFHGGRAEGEGAGLDLALMYGVIRQSGGDVQVHSSPDAGTVVRIVLPRLKA